MGITRLVKSGADRPESAVIAESLYAIICCLLCLTMLFELNRRAKLTKEMEMVRMLWKKDSKQLAERKDTIDLINMKCHDIRHKLEDYHLPITDEEEREEERYRRLDETIRACQRVQKQKSEAAATRAPGGLRRRLGFRKKKG